MWDQFTVLVCVGMTHYPVLSILKQKPDHWNKTVHFNTIFYTLPKKYNVGKVIINNVKLWKSEKSLDIGILFWFYVIMLITHNLCLPFLNTNKFRSLTRMASFVQELIIGCTVSSNCSKLTSQSPARCFRCSWRFVKIASSIWIFNFKKIQQQIISYIVIKKNINRCNNSVIDKSVTSAQE